MTEKKNPQDILARLNQAKAAATAAAEKKIEAANPFSAQNIADKIVGKDTVLGEVGRTAYLRYQFVKRAYDVAETIWNSKTLAVLSLGGSWAVKKYWGGCKWAFNKAAFDKTEAGEEVFNKKKAAFAFSALALFTYMIPSIARLGFEGIAIEGFSYQQTLLFGKAELVDNKANIWSVSSCTEYPCEGEVNTTEHRLTDSSWLDWKYALSGRGSHDPGELSGAFNSEQNACNVTQYGFRLKLPFVSIEYGLYPHIIKASCDSVDSDNWKEKLEEVKSRRPDVVAERAAQAAQAQQQAPALKLSL